MKNSFLVYSLRLTLIAVIIYLVGLAGIDLFNFFAKTANANFGADFAKITLLTEKGLAPLVYYTPALLAFLLYFLLPTSRLDQPLKSLAVASAIIPFALAMWFRIPTF